MFYSNTNQHDRVPLLCMFFDAEVSDPPFSFWHNSTPAGKAVLEGRIHSLGASGSSSEQVERVVMPWKACSGSCPPKEPLNQKISEHCEKGNQMQNFLVLKKRINQDRFSHVLGKCLEKNVNTFLNF